MKLINKICLLLVLVTGLGACEKKITDLQPIDLIPSTQAIQNMNDVINALNGVYATWSPRRSHYISALISGLERC
jgi:hypothetical protein